MTQVLGTDHHNFAIHLLEAELQRQVYRLAEGGQPVTAALPNERKRAVLRGFLGDTVEIDDGAAMTWMRQPHYYLGLCPYTYSVRLVAATALAEKSNREGDAVLAQWLDVLRAGGTPCQRTESSLGSGAIASVSSKELSLVNGCFGVAPYGCLAGCGAVPAGPRGGCAAAIRLQSPERPLRARPTTVLMKGCLEQRARGKPVRAGSMELLMHQVLTGSPRPAEKVFQAVKSDRQGPLQNAR